jgi:hypothetical protein
MIIDTANNFHYKKFSSYFNKKNIDFDLKNILIVKCRKENEIKKILDLVLLSDDKNIKFIFIDRIISNDFIFDQISNLQNYKNIGIITVKKNIESDFNMKNYRKEENPNIILSSFNIFFEDYQLSFSIKSFSLNYYNNFCKINKKNEVILNFNFLFNSL